MGQTRKVLARFVVGAVAATALALAGPGASAPASATCEFPRDIKIIDVKRPEGTPPGFFLAWTFTVTSEFCTQPGTVRYQTELLGVGHGYANSADFTATSGMLTFTAGDSSNKTISVWVQPDALAECDDLFQVRLFNPTGGVFIADATAKGVIDNDDGPFYPVRGHCGE